MTAKCQKRMRTLAQNDLTSVNRTAVRPGLEHRITHENLAAPRQASAMDQVALSRLKKKYPNAATGMMSSTQAI